MIVHDDCYFEVNIKRGVSPINVGPGGRFLTHQPNGNATLTCHKQTQRPLWNTKRVVVMELNDFFEEGAGI